MFVSFSDFFVLFVFDSIPLYLELIFCIISVLLNSWRCILWPSLWSILRMSHVCLRRVYTLLLLGGTFFRCQLEVSRCWTSICVFCFLVDLLPRSVCHTSVVLKSPASIVELFVSPVSTVWVCFLYFGTLFLGEDFLEETREHSC